MASTWSTSFGAGATPTGWLRLVHNKGRQYVMASHVIPSKGDRIEHRRLGVSRRGRVWYSDQLQMLVKWDDGTSSSLRIGEIVFHLLDDEVAPYTAPTRNSPSVRAPDEKANSRERIAEATASKAPVPPLSSSTTSPRRKPMRYPTSGSHISCRRCCRYRCLLLGSLARRRRHDYCTRGSSSCVGGRHGPAHQLNPSTARGCSSRVVATGVGLSSARVPLSRGLPRREADPDSRRS
jgi:hypothetical protein